MIPAPGAALPTAQFVEVFEQKPGAKVVGVLGSEPGAVDVVVPPPFGVALQAASPSAARATNRTAVLRIPRSTSALTAISVLPPPDGLKSTLTVLRFSGG
jgi:hypothetical protein